MKKMILTALLFAGITAAGFSQERPKRQVKTAEERAQMMTDHLDQKLSLNEKQKAEIYKINLERAKETDKAMSAAREARKRDFEKQKKSFQASDEKISKLLNDDQKKAYADLKAKHHDKMKKHRGDFKKQFKDRKGEEGKGEA